MSNETYVTIRGFVGADPSVFHNETSKVTVVVRVGVTARNFDRKLSTYVDGNSAWYSVRCHGDLAENVVRSVRKGSPVLVRGRLSPRMWTDKEGRSRIDYAIAADSIALDLNTGWATFVKARQRTLEPIEGEPAHAASNDESVVPEETAADSSSEAAPIDAEDEAVQADPAGVLAGVGA